MNIEERDHMFDLICQMSDRQVDPYVKRRLPPLKSKPNEEIKDELLGIIDAIIYCAFTSSFELTMLQIIWKDIGGTNQELEDRTKLPYEEVKKKYKHDFDMV